MPLFSSEELNICVGKGGTLSYMGPWLGGINNPKSAEDQWIDQSIRNYKGTGGLNYSSCPNCFSNLEIIGMSWFTMNCLDENQTKSGASTFTNFGQSSCNGTGTYIGSNEEQFKLIDIYPNPTTGKVTITESEKSNNKIDRVSVFNINGQNIYDFPNQTNSNFEVNLSSLPSGIYIIQVTSGADMTNTFKVIKY